MPAYLISQVGILSYYIFAGQLEHKEKLTKFEETQMEAANHQVGSTDPSH